jgi:hypothetical protein
VNVTLIVLAYLVCGTLLLAAALRLDSLREIFADEGALWSALWMLMLWPVILIFAALFCLTWLLTSIAKRIASL